MSACTLPEAVRVVGEWSQEAPGRLEPSTVPGAGRNARTQHPTIVSGTAREGLALEQLGRAAQPDRRT